MPVSNRELVERARVLATVFAQNARETELLRRPHPDNIAAMKESGLLEMLVPARFGGHESDLSTFVEVVEILSSACMSTAWIASFYIGHNLLVARFPEQAQQEVFAVRPYGLIPAANAPTLKARRLKGGWELNGRAPWGSGVMDADWCIVAGMSVEGDGARSFILPVADVEVVDTWHYAGMCGTGSNDMVLDNVIVPDHRSVPLLQMVEGRTPGSELHANPVFSAPLIALALCEIIPLMSGGLKGAVATYEANLQSRSRAYTGAAVKDQLTTHLYLGEMKIAAEVAVELVRCHAARTTQLLEAGDAALGVRVALRGHAAFIAHHCRAAMNGMMSRAGASNFHMDAPLQRYFRDINMLATHAFWDWDSSREQVGRLSFDLPPNTPLV